MPFFKYTEKRLAKDIGRVAESIDPALSCEYLPDSREVILTSHEDNAGGPFTVFLGNILLKVSDLPKKERLSAIEGFMREAISPVKLTPNELMESLALRVRTQFEIEFRNRNIELMGHDVPPSIAVPRGDLLVEVVSDRAESVSIATSDDLAEIGVGEDEAFRIAAARIRRDTSENQWEKIDEAIWISIYLDDYDFARLVAAEEFGRFPFEGPPIVFAPSHSVCLVTSSLDVDVLTTMVDLGNERAAKHRAFSQLLWTMDGANWREWAPASHLDVSEVARLQALRERLTQYEESKDYLDRFLRNEDVFVATFQATHDDEGLNCFCVYTFDVPSYLPDADFVAIVDPELPEDQAVVGRVSWDRFLRILGPESLEQIDSVTPPWYRVLRPLSTDQKDQIRKAAQPL
ncbi:MAG: hypothetical protein AAFY56_23270 [Pseudomonadota bacterium]